MAVDAVYAEASSAGVAGGGLIPPWEVTCPRRHHRRRRHHSCLESRQGPCVRVVVRTSSCQPRPPLYDHNYPHILISPDCFIDVS
jgi:hypothetical protein